MNLESNQANVNSSEDKYKINIDNESVILENTVNEKRLNLVKKNSIVNPENLSVLKLSNKADLDELNFNLKENDNTTEKRSSTQTLSKEKNHSTRHVILNLAKNNIFNELTQASIKIFQTPHLILKLFWILSIFLALGFCSFLIAKSIIEYLSFEVKTKTRTIFETPTLFPKVTLCNLNGVTTEYSYNWLFSQINNSSNDPEKKLLAHSLNDTLLSCNFAGQTCTSDDFSWIFDHEKFGNCYIFNSGFNSSGQKIGLKQAYIAGINYGLQLVLYVNYYDKLAGFNFPPVLGMNIQIGNSSYMEVSSGVNIPSGTITNLAVERYFEKNLPNPYSNCEIEDLATDSDMHDLINSSGYIYSQNLCLLQCKFLNHFISFSYLFKSIFVNIFLGYQISMITNCDCYDSTSFCLFKNISSCISINNTDCQEQLYADYTQTDYLKKICLPMCPLECNHNEYKISMSFNQLEANRGLYSYLLQIQSNPNLFSDFVTRPLNLETTKESIAFVNVFYEHLSYVESSESEAFGIVDMIASIGGTLGLFLGVSVLSICELLELLIETYFLKKEKKVDSVV